MRMMSGGAYDHRPSRGNEWSKREYCRVGVGPATPRGSTYCWYCTRSSRGVSARMTVQDGAQVGMTVLDGAQVGGRCAVRESVSWVARRLLIARL
eukprot:scaffold96615_cov27-Tisochrysis_lutea.AAC.3